MLIILMILALIMTVFLGWPKNDVQKICHFLDQIWAARGEGAQYWPAPQANNTGLHHRPTKLL
jgi:hypothetical protein